MLNPTTHQLKTKGAGHRMCLADSLPGYVPAAGKTAGQLTVSGDESA